MREAVLRLRGSFSIVVLSETEPGKLVAAKTATPMVLGLGDGENFVASDIPAILEHTRRAMVLEDGELAEVTAIRNSADEVRRHCRSLARRVKLNGTRSPRPKAAFAITCARKSTISRRRGSTRWRGGRTAASSTVRFEGELLPAGGPASIGRIVMLGAGASWITAQVGKFMIEHLAAIPVEVDYSSEFRYRRPPIDERTMIIAVSQSGETADTIAAMEEGRARGAHLLAITNTVDSSIARKADAQLYTRCGPETSVTTTKCFLTQLEAYYLFAIHLAARMGRLSESDAAQLLQPALAIPGQIKSIFESEPNIQQIARKYAQARDFLFLGRGINYPIALEGALKLKEISYIHAEGYSAGEMKHGPIALIDDKMPVVVIIPNDDLFEKSMSNLKEVESRNGRIIAVTNHATAELKSVAAEIIEVPETNRMLTPVLMTVPLQLLAYHIAVERGTDVDQPRNLAKSVTVE